MDSRIRQKSRAEQRLDQLTEHAHAEGRRVEKLSAKIVRAKHARPGRHG